MFRKPIASTEASLCGRTQTADECKTALAAETLRASGSIWLRVLGSSMLPSIWPGDIVKIEEVLIDEVVPGDIVLCDRNDRFFVHRLLRRSEFKDRIHWVTRGDSMAQNDPVFLEGQLLGRVSTILRGDRAIIPKRRLSYLGRFLGWTICQVDSVRNLALRFHSLRTSQRFDSLQARPRSIPAELLRGPRERRLAPR